MTHTTEWQGQSLGNDIVDISPDFVPNAIDATVIRRLIKQAETPRAIKTFAQEHRKLSDYGYWFMLGTLWVSYTGWSDLVQWKWLFSSPRPKRDTSLMKPSELRVWQLLPEQLLLYRAHRADEKDWISYTTDYHAAVRFAAQRNAREIRIYRVRKTDALCLFTRRCESEVLVLNRMHAQGDGAIEIGGSK